MSVVTLTSLNGLGLSPSMRQSGVVGDRDQPKDLTTISAVLGLGRASSLYEASGRLSSWCKPVPVSISNDEVSTIRKTPFTNLALEIGHFRYWLRRWGVGE